MKKWLITAAALFVVASMEAAEVGDWENYTLGLLNQVAVDVQKDGALPAGFKVRFGMHPSETPSINGGVPGAPDILVVTRGFAALAKRVGLTDDEYRAMLAHELGHMVLKHRFNTVGNDFLHQENEADTFARQHLGKDAACSLASALHKLAGSAGWPDGSPEKQRELTNAAFCKESTLVASAATSR